MIFLHRFLLQNSRHTEVVWAQHLLPVKVSNRRYALAINTELKWLITQLMQLKINQGTLVFEPPATVWLYMLGGRDFLNSVNVWWVNVLGRLMNECRWIPNCETWFNILVHQLHPLQHWARHDARHLHHEKSCHRYDSNLQRVSVCVCACWLLSGCIVFRGALIIDR